MTQCVYNLEEKYDCGGISEEDWNKIVLQAIKSEMKYKNKENNNGKNKG